MEGYQGAKILAKREVKKGEKIKGLLGKTAAITEEQLQDAVDETDRSFEIHSWFEAEPRL